MPADFLMLKWNHIKGYIIEHQSVRLSFSIINPGGLPKRNHIKISFRIIESSIISGEKVIYHLKEHIITRQGIAHPLAVSATLPAVSPVFVSCSPGMPCRTAPPTLSPVPFLSCLRLIETAPNDGHTIISERLIIIISKMKVLFR